MLGYFGDPLLGMFLAKLDAMPGTLKSGRGLAGSSLVSDLF